jgi:hypothetical protein
MALGPSQSSRVADFKEGQYSDGHPLDEVHISPDLFVAEQGQSEAPGRGTKADRGPLDPLKEAARCQALRSTRQRSALSIRYDSGTAHGNVADRRSPGVIESGTMPRPRPSLAPRRTASYTWAPVKTPGSGSNSRHRRSSDLSPDP